MCTFVLGWIEVSELFLLDRNVSSVWRTEGFEQGEMGLVGGVAELGVFVF